MKEKFIELENGKIVKFSDIKRIEKSYSSKYSNDFEPFHMVKKGEPVFKLLGLIPIKFAKNDCLKLDSFCNGRYGGYYSKYYRSVKELFDSIVKHWGEQAGSGYYAALPVAEATAGIFMSETKDALYFNPEDDTINVKPYITLLFDDFNETYGGFYGHIVPRRKFIIFNSDDELDKWMSDNISLFKTSNKGED